MGKVHPLEKTILVVGNTNHDIAAAFVDGVEAVPFVAVAYRLGEGEAVVVDDVCDGGSIMSGCQGGQDIG